MRSKDSPSPRPRQRVEQLFYLSQRLYRGGIPFLPRLVRFLVRVLYAAELPYQADIAADVHFSHNGLGIVIHPRVSIGEGTVIHQHVTIGGRSGIQEVPRIGRGVLIGAGAKILGDIEVGDGSQIGANAVVVKTLPPGSIVYSPLGKVVTSADSARHKALEDCQS